MILGALTSAERRGAFALLLGDWLLSYLILDSRLLNRSLSGGHLLIMVFYDIRSVRPLLRCRCRILLVLVKAREPCSLGRICGDRWIWQKRLPARGWAREWCRRTAPTVAVLCD